MITLHVSSLLNPSCILNNLTIRHLRQGTVVDLKAQNVNTGFTGSEPKVDSISVTRSKGKGCHILLSTKITWLLNTSYKLIVGSVSCCSSIHSIPLITVHVNIVLGTTGIKSAFLEIGSDIYNHFCGINIADELCEEPVVLRCIFSEITCPRLSSTQTTK